MSRLIRSLSEQLVRGAAELVLAAGLAATALLVSLPRWTPAGVEGASRWNGAAVGLLGALVSIALYLLLKHAGARGRHLEEQENRLRVITNALPDLLCYISPERRYVFNNRAYWDWFHRDPNSLQNEKIGMFMDPTAFRDLLPKLDSAFRGETVRFALQMSTPQGGRTCDVLYVPDRRPDGTVIGVISCVRDITQRRRAQEELMEEVRVMEALNRAGARLAGLLDMRRLLQEIADSAVEISGAEVGAVFYLPEPEREGAPVAYAAAASDKKFLANVGVELFGDSRALSESAVERAVHSATGGTSTDPLYAALFEGKFETKSYLSVPLVSSLGRCVGLLCFGHRREGVFDERAGRAAESLSTQAAIALGSARLYEELEYALRLKDQSLAELARSNSELQQFAYIASHDLKEPLRMVTSYVRLIEKRYSTALDQDGREFLQFAVEGATRMHSLINDLLAYSRVGTQGVGFQEVSSETAVRDALGNLRAAVEESGAQVHWAKLPNVNADPTQLVQLFQNLIGNAIKYRGEASPSIEISAQMQGELCKFAVKDNGIGIERQFWKRVFIIFQRLHPREHYQGTGIGLSICKKIVERHGGDIWVESEPGFGSTFYFTLPIPVTRRSSIEEANKNPSLPA